jgi:hypothetical protein
VPNGHRFTFTPSGMPAFYSFIIYDTLAGQRLNHAILATTEPQIKTIQLSDLDMFQNADIRFAITHNNFNSTNISQFPRDHGLQRTTTFIKTSALATTQGDCE